MEIKSKLKFGIVIYLQILLALTVGCNKKASSAAVEHDLKNELINESVTEIGVKNETEPGFEDIGLDKDWEYAAYSVINSGEARLYHSAQNRRGYVVGINAGHGTKGGENQKTYCHPDMSPKTTGGTTGKGALKATAVSVGMTFNDGTTEAEVTFEIAKLIKVKLLDRGYDVLMLRDGEDVQLDNIARTVIANNVADCLISLHWDFDSNDYDKGCFYISTPDGIKDMKPVSEYWEEHHKLGEALITGLESNGCKVYNDGFMPIDLTQTSYSCIPSVDLELGNQCSEHDEITLELLADGIVIGIEQYITGR